MGQESMAQKQGKRKNTDEMVECHFKKQPGHEKSKVWGAGGGPKWLLFTLTQEQNKRRTKPKTARKEKMKRGALGVQLFTL